MRALKPIPNTKLLIQQCKISNLEVLFKCLVIRNKMKACKNNLTSEDA